MDMAAKKTVLRQFSYGLYAVTVVHDGTEHGMTANWVTQAAFEPPMVVVAVENASLTIEMIRDAHHFGISIFHEGKRDVAARVGRASQEAPDKLKGIRTKPAPITGTPVLADCIGWLECRVITAVPAGDHTLMLGEVIEAGVEHADAKPLTLQAAGFKYSG